MAKEPIQHEDILGNPLAEGDYVATHRTGWRGRGLQVATIVKLAAKKIRVQEMNVIGTDLRFPADCIKIPQEPELLVYVMKRLAERDSG